MNAGAMFLGGILLIWVVSSGRAKAIWQALLNPPNSSPTAPLDPAKPPVNPYVPPGHAGPTVPPGWS